MNARQYGLVAAAALLSGCGFVHDEHLVGPYRLIAVDVYEQMNLSYSLDSGNAVGRIPETVFAVGWDDHYIVAKRHPHNDRAVTQFFYLDIARDNKYADPRTSVVGPLTESDFRIKQAQLHLPHFRRTIKSLE